MFTSHVRDLHKKQTETTSSLRKIEDGEINFVQNYHHLSTELFSVVRNSRSRI